MDVCLSELRQTGDLSRVYPASRPVAARIGSRPPVTMIRISGREGIDGWIPVLGSEGFAVTS